MLKKKIALGAAGAACVAALGVYSTRSPEPPVDTAAGVVRFADDAGYVDFAVLGDELAERTLAEVLRRDRVLESALAAKGLRLRVHLLDSLDDYQAALRQGTLEAGIIEDAPLIRAASQSPVRILAQAKRGYSSVVARRAAELSELKGRRIGFEYGSQGHLALLQGLGSVGMSERDIVPVRMAPDELPAALRAGRIDAYAASAPTAVLAEATDGQVHTLFRQLGSSYLHVGQRWFEQHPGLARELVAALARAMRWLGDDEANLRRAVQWSRGEEGRAGMERAAAVVRQDVVSGAGPLIPEIDLSGHTPLFHEFDFLRKAGQIPAAAGWEPVRDSIDTSVLQEVLAHAGQYRMDTFDYGPPP